jgi:antitoxin HicB
MSTATRGQRVLRFTVVLEPDAEDGGFTVTVPGLPGCVTEGDTREEALANAEEAITGFLEAMAKAGESLPIADTTEAVVVTVPAPR